MLGQSIASVYVHDRLSGAMVRCGEITRYQRCEGLLVGGLPPAYMLEEFFPPNHRVRVTGGAGYIDVAESYRESPTGDSLRLRTDPMSITVTIDETLGVDVPLPNGYLTISCPRCGVEHSINGDRVSSEAHKKSVPGRKWISIYTSEL